MSKDLVIKVGEYTKDGETKGEYVKLGVILSGENGEYALLDPAVSLAGCLAKQVAFNKAKGSDKKGDMLMCGIFAREGRPTQNQDSAANEPPF